MPVMVIVKGSSRSLKYPSILLASDSEKHGAIASWILQGEGFKAHFAGEYARLDDLLASQRFDVVLLEVTGEHAVEEAVAAALRVKRAYKGQFVGYLADAGLYASGLAGDGVFPRDATLLPVALHKFFAEDGVQP